MRIYLRHARALRYCSGAMRRFFVRHGLDWAAFVRDGIEAEQLLSTGDALAAAVVRHAQKEQKQKQEGAHGQQQ